MVGGEEFLGADLALDAFDHRAGVIGLDLWLLRIALVCPPPAIVADDGERGGKGPVDAGSRSLDRGDVADLAHQVAVAGGAESDIVREERGARDVVVAVDGIGAPDHGNCGATVAACHRRVVERVG